jgi:hypothetical protein
MKEWRTPQRRLAQSRSQPHLSERDLRLLREIARWGSLTVEQICKVTYPEPLFQTPTTAYGRLRALAEAGYVEFQRPFGRSPRQPYSFSRENLTGWVPFPGPGIYVVTWTGMREIGERPLPPTRITTLRRFHALNQQLLMVDLASWLMRQHPGTVWLTQRELLRHAMTHVREQSGRLLHGPGHVPEGVLIFLEGKRLAVELDLMPRPSRVYERIVSAHLAQPLADHVRWYASDLDQTLETIKRVVNDQGADDRIEVLPPAPGLRSESPWWEAWVWRRLRQL